MKSCTALKKKVCLRDTNQMQREQAHNGQEGQLSTETAKTNARAPERKVSHTATWALEVVLLCTNRELHGNCAQHSTLSIHASFLNS